MGKNHSNAKRKYWASFSPEQRSKIMSDRIKKMWANKTPEQKKARANLMVKARMNPKQ